MVSDNDSEQDRNLHRGVTVDRLRSLGRVLAALSEAMMEAEGDDASIVREVLDIATECGKWTGVQRCELGSVLDKTIRELINGD